MGRDGQDRLTTYLGSADGASGIVRIEVTLNDVSAAARNALNREVPGFEVDFVHHTGESVRNLFAYRFHGKRTDGKVTSYLVRPNGSKVMEDNS
jgi:hypothetical protein